MHALFVMAHAGHSRNFEWTLRGLADRGHAVTVAVESPTDRRGQNLEEPLRSIARDCPRVQVSAAPRPPRRPVALVGRGLRLWLDYLRFLAPEYQHAEALRARAKRTAPAARLVQLGGRPFARTVARIESRLPPARSVVRFLERMRPDALLVTPVVEFGSPQVEWIRAASALELPAMLPVASWDNLTVKGAIHAMPDAIAVWNETQVREAVELHGVPRDRIVVTGAVAYDHWFSWRPSRDRAAFSRAVGLRPESPYILYLCSSAFVAEHEAQFVLEWIRGIRSVPGLDEVDVLVRPHPGNPLDVGALEGVHGLTVFPRSPTGRNPVDEASRRDYYDSMYHAAAVVAVNTSAFIEAAILGRPAHALLGDRYRGTQEGTLHFHYLVEENGGPVRVAATVEEHGRQLLESLADPAGEGDRCARGFVERFVRPLGLDRPASAALVDAIEALPS